MTPVEAQSEEGIRGVAERDQDEYAAANLTFGGRKKTKKFKKTKKEKTKRKSV